MSGWMLMWWPPERFYYVKEFFISQGRPFVTLSHWHITKPGPGLQGDRLRWRHRHLAQKSITMSVQAAAKRPTTFVKCSRMLNYKTEIFSNNPHFFNFCCFQQPSYVSFEHFIITLTPSTFLNVSWFTQCTCLQFDLFKDTLILLQTSMNEFLWLRILVIMKRIRVWLNVDRIMTISWLAHPCSGSHSFWLTGAASTSLNSNHQSKLVEGT